MEVLLKSLSVWDQVRSVQNLWINRVNQRLLSIYLYLNFRTCGARTFRDLVPRVEIVPAKDLLCTITRSTLPNQHYFLIISVKRQYLYCEGSCILSNQKYNSTKRVPGLCVKRSGTEIVPRNLQSRTEVLFQVRVTFSICTYITYEYEGIYNA